MYCEKCGNQLKNSDSFCENCGSGVSSADHSSKSKDLENKSWYRLIKVIYTFFFFILIVILYFVFTNSSETYNYSSYGGSGSYTYDYAHGLWVTFLTFLFGSMFLKLLKVSFFYVASGVKPNWTRELKKIFNPFY